MNLREVKSLRKMNHKNIVKLIEIIRVNNDLHFVFEYCEGNLYEKVKNRTERLPDEDIKHIVY